jgi:hypothetical protein
MLGQPSSVGAGETAAARAVVEVGVSLVLVVAVVVGVEVVRDSSVVGGEDVAAWSGAVELCRKTR